MKDAARWPGFTLIVGVLATVALFTAGLGWQVVERRRLRARLAAGTPERPEDAAPLT